MATRSGSWLALTAVEAVDPIERRTASISDVKQPPVYQTIARQLKDAILRGDYPVGSRLPTENQLCESLGVSRYALREAMGLLRREKLIETRRKAGTFVLAPQPAASNFQHALSIDDILAFSVRWQFTVSTMTFAPLDPELAGWVGVPESEKWLAVAGVAQAHGSDTPENWVTYYINGEFAAIGRIFSTHAGRILPLIENMFGERIMTMTQQITADLMPAKLAAELKAPKNSPTIVVRSVYRTSEKVALITTETYPATRFHYVKTLHRAGDASAAQS